METDFDKLDRMQKWLEENKAQIGTEIYKERTRELKGFIRELYDFA